MGWHSVHRGSECSSWKGNHKSVILAKNKVPGICSQAPLARPRQAGKRWDSTRHLEEPAQSFNWRRVHPGGQSSWTSAALWHHPPRCPGCHLMGVQVQTLKSLYRLQSFLLPSDYGRTRGRAWEQGPRSGSGSLSFFLSLLNLLQYCFCFMLCFFAMWDLSSLTPAPPALGG